MFEYTHIALEAQSQGLGFRVIHAFGPLHENPTLQQPSTIWIGGLLGTHGEETPSAALHTPLNPISPSKSTHRPLSSSLLGLPYRFLYLNDKKELLGRLCVNPILNPKSYCPIAHSLNLSPAAHCKKGAAAGRQHLAVRPAMRFQANWECLGFPAGWEVVAFAGLQFSL